MHCFISPWCKSNPRLPNALFFFYSAKLLPDSFHLDQFQRMTLKTSLTKPWKLPLPPHVSSNPLAVNRHKSCTCIDAAPSPSSSMSVCIVSRKLLFSRALPLWQHPVSARWLNFRGNLVLYTHSRRPRIKMNSIQFGAFDLHCMTESKVEGSIPVMASLVFYG